MAQLNKRFIGNEDMLGPLCAFFALEKNVAVGLNAHVLYQVKSIFSQPDPNDFVTVSNGITTWIEKVDLPIDVTVEEATVLGKRYCRHFNDAKLLPVISHNKEVQSAFVWSATPAGREPSYVIPRQEISINNGHYPEILDRVHCIQTMLEELIVHHPIAPQLTTEINAVGEAIANLYQAAGRLLPK